MVSFCVRIHKICSCAFSNGGTLGYREGVWGLNQARQT